MTKRKGDSRNAFWKDVSSISFVYCDMCQQSNTSLTGTVQPQLGLPAGQVMVLISWAGTGGDDSSHGLCQLFLLEKNSLQKQFQANRWKQWLQFERGGNQLQSK